MLVPLPLAQECRPSDLWCPPLVSASALLASAVLISHAWQPSRVSWLSTPWSRTLLSLLLTQQSLLIEFIFVWIALVSVAWIFIRFNCLSPSSYVIPTVSALKLECFFPLEGKEATLEQGCLFPLPIQCLAPSSSCPILEAINKVVMLGVFFWLFGVLWGFFIIWIEYLFKVIVTALFFNTGEEIQYF